MERSQSQRRMLFRLARYTLVDKLGKAMSSGMHGGLASLACCVYCAVIYMCDMLLLRETICATNTCKT